MRVETTSRELYKFEELSEDAQDKAIEKLWDLNVDHDWWQFTYEDAENIGLKITEFDIDRGSYARGNFEDCAGTTAKKIIAEHGPECETVATAKNYLQELQAVIEKNAIENKDEKYPEDFLDTKDIDREFLRSLLEDYRIMLSKEYDYLTSREAIIESIEANEYEFLDNGTMA
jgi:hypothetical protein